MPIHVDHTIVARADRAEEASCRTERFGVPLAAPRPCGGGEPV